MRLSLIIPALNEADGIESCLTPLQRFRDQGHQVILVDGGSADATRELAGPLVDRLLQGGKGRALQMNAGAAAADGDVLVFLHADTLIVFDIAGLLENALGKGEGWGRFDVRLSGRHFLLRVVEFLMNARSRYSGIATGDQAMFVSADLFRRCGGFREIPLMEDIELCARLRACSPPVCLRERVITSSRRWERDGILRTVFKMWRLRLRYALGADPRLLAREYE